MTKAAEKMDAGISNDYSVPQRQWAKWSVAACRAFNGLYYVMSASPHLFQHPQADVVSGEYWSTTVWNAAWMAAEAVDGR